MYIYILLRRNVYIFFQRYQISSGIEDFVATAFKKLHDRLSVCQQPTLSIVSRCIGFNTFILSVMPYTMSFFGLNSQELNRLRQTAVGFILKRHWIAAEILPFILRFLKDCSNVGPGPICAGCRPWPYIHPKKTQIHVYKLNV